MARSGPHPRRRNRFGARVGVIWLPTVVIGTLTILGLYHARFGVGRADLERWRQIVRTTPSGDVPREIESDFNQRFLPSFAARTLAFEIPTTPLPSSAPDRVVGRSGRVFVREDVAVAFGRSFMSRREHRPRDAIRVLRDFNQRMRERQIHLIVVPVPAKSTMYPHDLDDAPGAADAPRLNAGHDQWLAELRGAGVEVFDPTQVLWNHRQETPLFFDTDTHWTQPAKIITAEALAPRVSEILGSAVARQAFTRRSVAYTFRPDSDEARDHLSGTHFQLLADGRPAIFDQTAPLLVLGDSYAAHFSDEGAGFPQMLALATGVPVQSAAEFGVQASLMTAPVVRRPDLLDNKKLVVLLFSLRKIQCNDWTPPPGGG